MAATIHVELEALEGMAATVSSVDEGLVFSHRLTGDCSWALGSGSVGAALSEVTTQLARRADLMTEVVGRLASLPAEFAAAVRAVDDGLAASVAGGGGGVATGVGEGAR